MSWDAKEGVDDSSKERTFKRGMEEHTASQKPASKSFEVVEP